MLHAQSPSITFKRSRCLHNNRELSVDGGENITLKIYSRFFTLCRVYFSSLKTSNGKRERKIRRRLFTSSVKREISEFTQQDGRKKRTGNRLCVTNLTRLLLAFFVVIFTDINVF